jgi:3-deoxy-D-manno-octulosonate 8-phosphate phosphatase (KDO 8-P phosphatase)
MNAIQTEDKLKGIKLLVMDVDGTMTDSGVYYSRNGEELKRFSIRDGMGIELLHIGGIDIGIITSETSQIVTSRAAKLKINHVVLGSRNKKVSLSELSKKLSVPLKQIAFIGDDVNDIQAMKICGVSACPSDSAEEVKKVAVIQLTKPGGNGAIRELAEILLKSQDKSITLPDNW